MSRVAVVGFGALGAGAAWALARRGHDVVVLERHGVANRVGSSAGASRIFRLAYPEVDYVSLCIDALALWRRLEAETGSTLYVRRGLLERGERALDYASALATCDLAHRVLDGAETPALFPELVPRPASRRSSPRRPGRSSRRAASGRWPRASRRSAGRSASPARPPSRRPRRACASRWRTGT